VDTRRVVLQGAWNVRDLGGLVTASGEGVARGRVYRSDGLHRLTSADRSVLEQLRIMSVFDLRSDAELARDGIGAFARERHTHVPLVAVSLSPYDPEIDWARVNLRERYVEMLTVGHSAIRAVLEAVAKGETPLLFHCSGGKDRTGVVAAVLLRVLGVPDTTIVEDYALSEGYLRAALAGYRDELQRRRLAPDVIGYLTSSPPDRMRFTLRELDRRWGSTLGYLRWIGVDDDTVDHLRAGLLR
jgi:protein-tyrosine phosphatase